MFAKKSRIELSTKLIRAELRENEISILNCCSSNVKFSFSSRCFQGLNWKRIRAYFVASDVELNAAQEKSHPAQREENKSSRCYYS